jgi:hypothetical protein
MTAAVTTATGSGAFAANVNVSATTSTVSNTTVTNTPVTNVPVETCTTHGDEAGNTIKWFTTMDIKRDVGATMKLTCKVKAHEEYKGVKGTLVSHGKIGK